MAIGELVLAVSAVIVLSSSGTQARMSFQASTVSVPDMPGLLTGPRFKLRLEDHFSGRERALAQAAGKGDADAVRRLIKGGADPDAVSPRGLPLIAWPIRTGSVTGVQALLANGADPNRPTPAFGPAIVLAAKAADPAILRAFLDRGGDPDAISRDRKPLLIVAQFAGRWENVKLLVLRGADINARAHGQAGDTVLRFYSAGQFDKAYWLLERGADPGYRIEDAPAPERIGAQPIVENIYWWPVHAGQYPALAQWQRKCQDLLAAAGLHAPPEPAHLRRLRDSRQRPAPPP